MLKRASLGYDGLLADIYWTRAVQYFGGRHHNNARSYNLLFPLLEITTHLDPQLVVAYQFGASFLAPPPPNGAGQPERAIQLMEYGIQNNPDNWKLYYDLGFVYYMNLKDYQKAAEAFERARRSQTRIRLCGCWRRRWRNMPESLTRLECCGPQPIRTARTSKFARMRWNICAHCASRKTSHIFSKQLRALASALGACPSSMAELVTAEGLPGIPVDPDGHPYKLTPEGRVEVRVPDDFPFATKGLASGI